MTLGPSFRSDELEKALRKVRTPAGVKFFGMPIGSIISPGMVKLARAAHGDKKVDAMLDTQKRNARRDGRRAHFQNQAEVRAKKRVERVEGNAARRDRVKRDADIRARMNTAPKAAYVPSSKIVQTRATPSAHPEHSIKRIEAVLSRNSAVPEESQTNALEDAFRMIRDASTQTKGTEDYNEQMTAAADALDKIGDELSTYFDAAVGAYIKGEAAKIRGFADAPKKPAAKPKAAPAKTQATNTDMDRLFDLVHANGKWSEAQVSDAILLAMKLKATADPMVRELLMALVKRLQKEE